MPLRLRVGSAVSPLHPSLRLALGFGMALCLAACSGQEQPRAARILPPQPTTAALGDGYVAHYNLVPTLALGEAIAREYAVERRAGSALLVVAIRSDAGDGEQPAQAQAVSAEVRDLSGRTQSLTLRSVRTGDYTDHVGTVAISQHDTLRLEVLVSIAGGQRRFRFERGF